MSGILNNSDEKLDKSFSEERFHHQLSKNRKKIELVKKIELQNYSDVTTCDTYQNVIGRFYCLAFWGKWNQTLF